MDLQDKRRRTRANEWSPYECPVGFDDILQDRDRERDDAIHAFSQQETIQDEPMVSNDTSDWANQHHFFPPDRKLSWSFQRTRDRFFDNDTTTRNPIGRQGRHTEELLLEPDIITNTNPRRFGHAARPSWSSFDLTSNNGDYNMGLISIAIFVFFFVLIWLIVLAIVWKCRSKTNKHLQEFNTTFQSVQELNTTLQSSNTPNSDENDDEDENLVRMEFESAASPRWLDFPKTKSKSFKSTKSFKSGFSSVASFFTTNSSVDGDEKSQNNNINNNNNKDTSLNTSGESYTSQFYRLGLVKNGKVDVSRACDNLSATPSSHQRKATNNICDKLPWDEILGGLYTDWVNNANHSVAGSNSSPLGNQILRDLEQLETKMDQNNFSTRTERSENDSDLNASTISSMVTTRMQQKNQQNLLSEEGVEIWYDTTTQSFFRMEGTQAQPFDPPENQKLDSRRIRIFDICPWWSTIFGYRNLMPSCGDSVDDPKKAVQRELQRRRKLTQPREQGVCDKIGIAVFFLAGAVILISSFSMAIFGANKLADATSKASQFVDDAQALAVEGNTLLDGYLETSPFSGQSSSIVYGEGVLLGSFENLTQQLYKTTNTYCDFYGQDQGVDEALTTLATIYVEHMSAPSMRYDDVNTDIFNEMELLHSDLAKVSDTTAALEEYWIGPFHVVVVALRIANCLLFLSCLALLVGVAKQRLAHPAYRCFVIPLFTLLVVLSFMACLAFLMGSTLLQDFCLAGPDEQLLEFLSSSSTNPEQPLEETVESVEQASETLPWIDMMDDFLDSIMGNSEDNYDGEEDRAILSYEIAQEYIQQCPSEGAEGAPTGVVIVLERGWEFTRALWEVSVLLANPGTCVNQRTPVLENENETTPIVQIGQLVMEASCDFSVFLTGIIEVFQCDKWYQLYQEGFHQAACELGTSGLMWVSATQFIIVIFALIMLTIRVIASPFYGDDKIARNGDSGLQNSTMLIEDEEQLLKGQASPPETSRFLSKLSDCQFRKEDSKLTASANSPHKDRSSERILRKSPQKTKPGTNYLASTDLWGGNFEGANQDYDSDDDDDENIEVCLHPGRILDDEKENRLQRLNCLSKNRSDLTATILSDRRPRSFSNNTRRYSKFTNSKDHPGWSASSDEYKSEFERVTDRLKSMNWKDNNNENENESSMRRESSLKKNKEFHRQRSAPADFLVTVTTNDGNESNAPWWTQEQ